MKAYIIESVHNGKKEYTLHSDNNLYLGYVCCGGVKPLVYKRKSYAQKKINQVQYKYPNYELIITEINQ